jgi:hypothetical protein
MPCQPSPSPMHMDLETRYSPILEPGDPASLPAGLPRDRPPWVPLAPDRRGRARGRRWLRGLATAPWGHFCVSDHVLRRLETADPLGLRLARDAGVAGVVTMDVPVYAFMTAAQRERAQALHLHRLLRTMDGAPRHGLGVVPLVKALTMLELDRQLDLLEELGVRRAAVYAREFLLERDDTLLRRFVRGAHRRRIRPLLLGACGRRAASWGPVDLAARRQYVLARRGEALRADGHRERVVEATWSRGARRFLMPGRRSDLCTHNYWMLHQRLRPVGARLGA